MLLLDVDDDVAVLVFEWFQDWNMSQASMQGLESSAKMSGELKSYNVLSIDYIKF